MNNLRSLCWGLDDFPEDKAPVFCERNIHRQTELSVLVSLGGLRWLAKPLHGSPRSSGRNLPILVNIRPMRRLSPPRSERRVSYRVAFIDFWSFLRTRKYGTRSNIEPPLVYKHN